MKNTELKNKISQLEMLIVCFEFSISKIGIIEKEYIEGKIAEIKNLVKEIKVCNS